MNLISRLSSLNLLDRGFHIRRGVPEDVNACDRIARLQERLKHSSLGWVRKDDFHDFHVALFEDEIVGFVLFHHTVKGVDAGMTVIKALAVDERYAGLGIGRNLLYSVECPIRLRCPHFINGDQLNPANPFYRAAGMKLASIEKVYRGGEKRGQIRSNSLNVWELPILPILVMGSNFEMPEIARRTGWGYGVRDCEAPRDWPYQVDLEFQEDWRSFDWNSYIDNVRQWKPFAALALDYFEPAQLPTLLFQIEQLKQAGVMRILVCPKFDGAVKDIPPDCIVAISVPSRYAGFVPDLREISGRKLHLLGGSPTKWFGSKSGRKNRNPTGYIALFQAAGAQVISVDGNSHEAAAQTGTYWIDGLWKRPVDGTFHFGNRFETMLVSGRNILSDLHKTVGVKQYAWFGEAESDV